jgi:hypothetical protein
MKGTADFHDAIANARLPEAAGLGDHAAALAAAVDVLKAHAAARHAPIRRFLRPRALPSSRLPGRHEAFYLVKRARQEAQIRAQAAACGHGRRRGLRKPFLVRAAGVGLTQQEERERGVAEPHVFPRVALFLAAITARWLRRSLGAREAPCAPIVPTRGEARAGAAPGGSEVVGDRPPAATLASATPRRLASSVTDRVGVSPSARSVACRTTNRT